MVQTTPTDPAALARRPDTVGPLAVATPTTRKLADASISVNTRRAYDGVLLTVRTSKTNQEGDAADVRYLKNGAANAIRTLRAAGIEARVTAHSGRVGLASELTARGASTTEVMLAGNWRTSRMVAHYSAGATAERGAVAKYL